MYLVFLRFGPNKAHASRQISGHNEWIQRGLQDGVFLLVGSLAGGQGGLLVAHNASRTELDARVNEDPFVAERIVDAEIIEVAPSKADERLAFLLATSER